jgi:broad specificity phosphatase PhoE
MLSGPLLQRELGSLALRLLFIRHAHTYGNGGVGSPAVLQGRTDLPLSARGQEEVRLLRLRLRRESRFDAVYSSPLRRARETAASLSNLGELHLCPDLQEIDCGMLDGIPLEQVRRDYPDLWASNLQQTDEHFRWPGGESYHEFRSRCLRTVAGLAARHEGYVAVVTHAGVISQVLGALAGKSPAQWEPFRPGHTALTELLWTTGGGIVLRYDDRTHLTGASNRIAPDAGSAPARVRPPKYPEPVPSRSFRDGHPH